MPNKHKESMNRINKLVDEYKKIADKAQKEGTTRVEFEAVLKKLEYHIQGY
jgi:hypothetical protein